MQRGECDSLHCREFQHISKPESEEKYVHGHSATLRQIMLGYRKNSFLPFQAWVIFDKPLASFVKLRAREGVGKRGRN
jgi:hypothetical protein